MESNELDPCLAAEARMKESVISNKVKLLILCIGIVLLLILLGLGLFFLLRSTPTMEDLYDDPVMFEPAVLTGKDALYEEKHRAPVTTKPTPPPRTTERPTTRPPPAPRVVKISTEVDEKEGETKHTFEVKFEGDQEKKESTTSTTEAPTTAPTTLSSFVNVPTTSPPAAVSPTVRIRTPFNRAEPTVATVTTQDLQSHPTNVPLTDDVRKSCVDHLRAGYRSSGIYKISPDGEEPFFVFCDQETAGGGWAVVQRRTSDEGKFETNYFDRYEPGFGSLRGNHWLGLVPMHRIAPSFEDPQTLRIELRGDTCTSKFGCSGDPDGFWWGEWNFALGTKETGYVLRISEHQLRGNMTNPSVNKMAQWQIMSNGQRFSTFEKDVDEDSTNCAQMRNRGAWWHKDCTTLALNGRYGQTKSSQSGLFFYRDADKDGYTIHPRQTLMMLRPHL